MDKGDMDKLWSLFSVVWSRSEKVRDERLKLAWSIALEPYAYRDVRAAAAEYIRKNKFFPDIWDITVRLEKGGGEPIENGASTEEFLLSRERLRRNLDALRGKEIKGGNENG